MNFDDLNAEIARCGLSIPKLADKIGIGKKAMYSRMRGETNFNQSEIAKISKVLNLNGDKILSIFLAIKFPKRHVTTIRKDGELRVKTPPFWLTTSISLLSIVISVIVIISKVQ